MLIHVTRFTSVQGAVHQQVENWVEDVARRLSRRIGHNDIEDRLTRLWHSDFVPTSARIRAEFSGFDDGLTTPQLDAVMTVLPDVIGDIQVRRINGTAGDVLDYADQKGPGLKVIAIGGDKLSRGLTLEGLCVSYFLRTSKMYDTLMQMGRWFGYRPSYIDLCRLYTTAELGEWFGHIADAAEELREEFDLMAASGATPRQYGLKVQSHPVLMVTSRLKMRSAKNLMLSFSGQVAETVSFDALKDVLARNLDAVRKLTARLGQGQVDPVRDRDGSRQSWKGALWTGVSGNAVADFLTDYRTHPDAYKVNSKLLAEFVRSMIVVGELSDWTVAVIGGGRGAPVDLGSGLVVDSLVRTANEGSASRYSIGRLLSPRDEAIDLDAAQYSAALSLTRHAWRADTGRLKAREEPGDPSGPAIRRVRGEGYQGVAGDPRRALLLIYVLDPEEAGSSELKGRPPVAAFGVSFPASDAGVKIEYRVNNVAWEQDYGGAD
jgi:hypothetical protein